MAKRLTIAVATRLVLVVSVSVPAALADADFIARTCQSADNAHCAKVLSTDPRSANATTVRDLAGIALDIAASNARDSSKSKAIEVEAGKHADTPLGDALDDCGTFYVEAIDALEEARGDLDLGYSYGEAEQQTAAAEDAGDKCEKAFSDRQLASTVTDVDKRMKDRCGVASDLIDLLYVQSHRFLRV